MPLTDFKATDNLDRAVVTTSFTDGPTVDAFGRARVSNSKIVFNSSFIHNGKDFLFNDLTASGGSVAYNATKGQVDLSVTTASGSRAVRQTREYITYVPAVSPLVYISFKYGSLDANRFQCIGFYDDDNGIYTAVEGSTPIVGIRSNVSGSVVNTKANQTNWNIDKLDGTGVSRKTLDLSKIQLVAIDFQWLAVGRVRIGFVIDGQTIYVHEFVHGNVIDEKYMRTATLPIRAEIENTGAASTSSTLELFCMSRIDEGMQESASRLTNVSNGFTNKVINASSYRGLVSFRAQNGVRATLDLVSLGFLADTSDEFHLIVVRNADLTGASFSDIGTSSIAQKDTSATTVTFNDDDVIFSTYVQNNGQVTISFPDTFNKVGSQFNGDSDVVTLATRSLNNNARAYGSLTFTEKY